MCSTNEDTWNFTSLFNDMCKINFFKKKSNRLPTSPPSPVSLYPHSLPHRFFFLFLLLKTSPLSFLSPPFLFVISHYHPKHYQKSANTQDQIESEWFKQELDKEPKNQQNDIVLLSKICFSATSPTSVKKLV